MTSKIPAPGSKAPAFTLLDQDEEKISLKDYAGSWVVLYFYPRDNTPGCTVEALEFTALHKEFQKLNCYVLGISKDSCASHRKFVDQKDLQVLLLSDEDTKMQQKYGVWQLKKFMGRESMGTVRTTFLIDPKGKIAKTWKNVKAKGHAETVLTELRELSA